MTNGRTYTLALAPRRICDVYAQKNAAFLRDSWWLYPGDTAEFELGRAQLEGFRDGANVLEVEVLPHVAPMDLPLTVVLEADGRVLMEQPWQPEGTMKRRRITWPIDPPMPPNTEKVVLRFINPSGKAFPLLTSVTLAEDYDMFSERLAAVASLDPSLPAATVSAAVERTGDVLLELDPKKGTMTSQGAFELKVFPLWPVSDSYLEKLGIPPASPVTLSVDGRPFTHEPDRKTFRDGCADCFYHSGQSILLYGEGVKKQSEVAVALSPALPGRAMDGSPTWWVYPGTTVTWALPAPVRGSDLSVVVEGVALHAQKEAVGTGFFLTGGGLEAPIARGVGEGVVVGQITVPSGAVDRVAIRGEAPGGFLLVRRLRVQGPGGVTWLVEQPMPDGGKTVGGED